jgi:predicted DNA-binding transcriptional regulator YafY
MDRSERFYRIDQLLHERGVVPRDVFLDELEVSLATFKRDLEYMRDRYNAPVVWDPDAGGYRFDKQPGVGPRYELPGLWFNESEVLALLTMEHLLSSLDEAGVIGPHIAPLRARLTAILGTGEASAQEVRKRIRLLAFAPRKLPLKHFEELGRATLKRQRVHVVYYARSTDVTSERDVSPQRLVHYRGNWYVDGWCHLRKDLRTFAIDGIRNLALLGEAAREVPVKTLEDYLATGYGIMRAGSAVTWAKLRFSAERARWVGSEVWHPDQRGVFDPSGRFTLELPYRDDRELLLEIMKHGGGVEVLAPAELRRKIHDAHVDAAQMNACDETGVSLLTTAAEGRTLAAGQSDKER